MSCKSTRTVNRATALSLILAEVTRLSNDKLAEILDMIADSEQAHVISKFDNFIVSDYSDHTETIRGFVGDPRDSA